MLRVPAGPNTNWSEEYRNAAQRGSGSAGDIGMYARGGGSGSTIAISALQRVIKVPDRRRGWSLCKTGGAQKR